MQVLIGLVDVVSWFEEKGEQRTYPAERVVVLVVVVQVVAVLGVVLGDVARVVVGAVERVVEELGQREVCIH